VVSLSPLVQRSAHALDSARPLIDGCLKCLREFRRAALGSEFPEPQSRAVRADIE